MRGDLAEQARLVAERAQVRQTVAAVGEHDRQVAQGAAGIVARAPLAHVANSLRQRLRQPDPVGEAAQQRRAGARGKESASASTCRLSATSERCTHMVILLGREIGLDKANPPCSGGHHRLGEVPLNGR